MDIRIPSRPFVRTPRSSDQQMPPGWASYELIEQGRKLFEVVYDPRQHDIVVGIGRLGRQQRFGLVEAGYEPLVALGDRPVWIRRRPEATVVSLEQHRVSARGGLARRSR